MPDTPVEIFEKVHETIRAELYRPVGDLVDFEILPGHPARAAVHEAEIALWAAMVKARAAVVALQEAKETADV